MDQALESEIYNCPSSGKSLHITALNELWRGKKKSQIRTAVFTCVNKQLLLQRCLSYKNLSWELEVGEQGLQMTLWELQYDGLAEHE